MKSNNREVVIGTVYRPPNQTSHQVDMFLADLQLTLDKARTRNPGAIILLGDFNDRCDIWDSSHRNSELKRKLINLSVANNLKQLISCPTFYTPHSANILDLIFTDAPSYVINHGVLAPIDHNASYIHCPVFCKIRFNFTRDVAYKRHVWSYDKGDFANLNYAIYSFDWRALLVSCTSATDAAVQYTSKVLDMSRTFIPNRIILVRPQDKPWMTCELRREIRRRDRLIQKHKLMPNSLHRKNKWHDSRTKVNHLIRHPPWGDDNDTK